MDGMSNRWKAIGQVVPRRALALIPCKQPPKVVLQFVYRSGRHALENWGRTLKEASKIGTHAGAIQRIAFAGRLQIDCLSRVISPGHVYSLPCVQNCAALEDVSATSLVAADDVLHSLAHDML